MNCLEFDKIIVNLACNVMVDAAEHTRALAHAETCGQCGARLARQQNVVTGLQALAEQEQTIKAPAYLGLALQAAFEKQRADSAGRAVSSPKPVGHWLNHHWLNQLMGWGMNWRMVAAVAVLLIISTLATALLWRTRSPGSPKSSAVTAKSQAEQPANTPLNIGSEKTAHATSTPPIKRQPRQRLKPARRETQEYGALLSLMPIAQTEPDEFQQVVRMQIPRSTLRLWGLPVNEESTIEQVSAEVYFSEDGVARAIRLRN